MNASSTSQQPASATRSTPQTLAGLQRRRTNTARETAQGTAEPAKRLVSLDAYRGFIMIMLASVGFGIHSLSQLPETARVWQTLDYAFWHRVGGFHFAHPEWISNFHIPGYETWLMDFGVSFWDLIQPAFMFMVGVAMPYSFAKREQMGHSTLRRTAHAVWRALVLVLLGVFLSSNWSSQTNWTFVNVLSQIGLGYLFVYILMGRKFWIQLSVFVLILVGYWGLFFAFPPPVNFDYAKVEASELAEFPAWSKNSNIAHRVDVELLNMFPRAEKFEYNPGGYTTLNFVPSIATMLLGVFCGQLLRSGASWWKKFLLLVAGGALCMLLGVVAGHYACPVVKRIWTPSWVLLSGGWVIWMLAGFYLVFDLCRLRWLAFPLVVVGMNSIAMYMMGQLLRPFATKTIEIHFLGLLQHIEIWTRTLFLADDLSGRVLWPTAAFLFFWLIAFWMYRQKFFIRV